MHYSYYTFISLCRFYSVLFYSSHCSTCFSFPASCLQQINPSPADSPPPRGGVSEVKRRPAGLNRCPARALPLDRSVHLAADQKLTASASPSFFSSLFSFFLHLPACERLLRRLQSIPRGSSLSWLVGSSEKHAHRKYKYTPAPPCVTRQTVVRAVRLWEGGGLRMKKGSQTERRVAEWESGCFKFSFNTENEFNTQTSVKTSFFQPS